MLVLIGGTRPEFLKLGPIVAQLHAKKIPHVFLATGQHQSLLEGGPAGTDLKHAEQLGIPATGELLKWPSHAQPIIQAALSRHRASLVVVQGDTMSAVVGARAADALGIHVAHVEAGIRSGDPENPFPEEMFRREITQLSTYHFAATLHAYDTLIAEGIPVENLFLTGNPIVSAIERYTDVQPVPVPDMTILFTMHRREWLLSGLKGALDGFLESAHRYPELVIVWPMHPGVTKLVPTTWIQSTPTNVHLIEPLAYLPTMRLLARSLGVATDSGGLQEEAATLGVPCAVLRHATDRPESVQAGTAQLFPPTYTGITEAFKTLRDRTILRQPIDTYGSPHAASNIAQLLGNLASSRQEMPKITGKHFSAKP